MSLSNNFPAIKPSLNLDFANVKALDPRVTFTRTTTATYYGTETAKAEENLLLQSQDFSTTWTNNSTTDSANTAVAPDGTTTADTITEAANTGFHFVRQAGVSVTSGVRYIWSVFAKKGDGATAPDIIQVSWHDSGFFTTVFANYDISVGGGTSGTVTTTGAGAVSASIVDVGNGWYRCVLIADATATATSGMAVFFTNNNPTATRAPSYLGVVTADVFLWGAQLEQRSAVTAYTPTTTQPITNYIPVLETAASGVARFDHNPTTGESLGLLVEEQRTNLVERSEEFDNAYWTKTGSSITGNTIVAPDGTLTADKIVEGSGALTFAGVTRSNTVTAATSYAQSVYLKAGERTWASLRVFDSSASPTTRFAFFNLSTGAVGTTSSGVTVSVTPVGNNWYRCAIVYTSSATTNTFQLTIAEGDNDLSWTGNGFDGIFIWGAQLEEGAFPTSYIPTVAASVTRNADEASMTGTNFSSWFNNAEGTFYGETTFIDGDIRQVFQAIDSGTVGSNDMGINSTSSANNPRFRVNVNAVNQAEPSVTLSANLLFKAAAGYKVDNINIGVNGSLGTLDTSATLPVVDRLFIGQRSNGSRNLNTTIRKLAFYPSRLTDAQLQALTA